MLNSNRILYSYKDVTVIPSVTSIIDTRSECCPYTPEGNLPIFAAPMSTIISDDKDIEVFERNKILPVIPRSFDLSHRLELLKEGKWVSFGLGEFEREFTDQRKPRITSITRVCLDIANGHMEKLLKLVEKAKQLHPSLKIMTGNIANPKTIVEYCKAGVDYVRVGIGGGSGCITSSNTSIHYPMASLISDTVQERDLYLEVNPKKTYTQIIADGGIRGYADIIKALALGADYVMIGGVLAGCYGIGKGVEAFLDTHELDIDTLGKITYKEGKFYALDKLKTSILLKRRFYGMASRSGQKDINGKAIKTAEGLEKEIPIIITVGGWVENFTHYLRSAMSYCSSRWLSEFPDKAEVRIISPGTQSSINP